MDNLWITLPALAPDYSGVCSAMFDLGGISVIHDASGCTGNYTGYDEPRWYGSTAKVFSSGLREMDAVLGLDNRLIDNIIKAGECINPTMYTVIGSPVPMVIGTDMTGVAYELEKRTGVLSFGFDMNGIGIYDEGISKALCALIQRLTVEAKEKIHRGINILGSNPLDLSANSNAEDLKKCLEQWGFPVNSEMMMGASLKQVEDLTKAEINLVVTKSGLKAAKLLHEKFQIPYVVGMPLYQSKLLRDLLEKTWNDKTNRVLLDSSEEGEILIVGEQVLSNSIRSAIKERIPHKKVCIATLCGFDEEIAAKGDTHLTGEENLTLLINSGKYTTLMGDPLLEELIDKETSLNFIGIPHAALSSKLYWKNMPRLLREDMEEIIDKITKI